MKQNGVKQINNLVIRLGAIIIVFVIVSAAYILNYIHKTTDELTANVSKTITNTVEDYALQISTDAMLFTSETDILSQYVERGETHPYEYMAAAIAQGSVEEMYVVDASGSGYNQTGENADVHGLFSDGFLGQVTDRIFVPCVSDDVRMIAYIIPTDNPQGETLYCISLAKADDYGRIFKTSDFDALTAYFVTDSHGNILAKNSSSSVLASSSNIWDNLDETDAEVVRLKSEMLSNQKCEGDVAPGTESRRLIIIQAGKTPLRVVAGVNKSYYKYRTGKDIKRVKNLRTVLLLGGIIFICVLVGNILSYTMNSDITKKQLEEKADTDLLTGLNNKLATERKIKQYMESHPDTQCMVLLFDIDNFKKINDTKGHAFGDEVLKTLGETISTQFRVSDIIGRIGGDEFMIFLKDIPSEDIAVKEAVKIMHFFKDFTAGGYVKYSATASVGAALFPAEGADFETIYKAADSALYRSKQNGRNQLNFYNEKLGTIKV